MNPYDIPDWAEGDERHYEQHWSAVLGRGLCVLCEETASLPDSQFCEFCSKEMRAADREDEAA